MSIFSKREGKEASTPKENYIETYGKVVKDVFSLGGFPLVLAVTSGILALAISASSAIEALKAALPWFVGFSSLFLVCGVLLYIYETSWKRRMLQRALDRFDELSKIVLSRYLESKDRIDYETVRAALDLINAVTHADRDTILSRYSEQGAAADRPRQLGS